MPTTDQFYGGRAAGPGRTIQDFGLCDLKGLYVSTLKARAKGLLVVVFFSPDSPPSVRALKAVQQWTQDIPTDKWSAIGVAGGDRDSLAAFAQQNGIDTVTLLLDHELYQTRMWGVSTLPSLYLIAGKTGRIVQKALGDSLAELNATQEALQAEIAKIVAAEEAAKEAARKAEEGKKAADAAKAAEAAKEPAKA